MEEDKKYKIFISYGHDYTEEAKMFAQTLTGAGYDVWIDYAGIEAGSDWRERITAAIMESDYFVALFSKYGLRKGGVCLDELAIAVSHNRNNICPVALEKGVEYLAPSSVAAKQFFDMTEWREKKGDDFDAWYKEKTSVFLNECLRRPAQYEKRLSSLKSRLRFTDAFSRENFDIGKEFWKRVWLDEKIEEWLGSEKNICLLRGFPGFGKSCYCSEFSHFDSRACGLIFCDKYVGKNDGAYKLIRETSFAFAVRIPSFAMRLDMLLNDAAAAKEFDTLEEAFDFFILEPMRIIDGNMEDALVIIDGVDMFYKNGENAVLDVFCKKACDLPRFARIMLTARKTAIEIRADSETYKVTVAPDDKNVFSDIEEYLANTLKEVVAAPREAERIGMEIARRAQGSFLYASAVGNGIKNGSISLEDASSLPSKVADVYFGWMKKLVSPETYGKKYVDILSVLVALENPPIELIKNALGIKRSELFEALRDLSVLLVKNTDKFGNTCVSFYSDSFAEWISDENAAGVYAVFCEDGLITVADYFSEAAEDEELTDYDYTKAVSVLRRIGKRKRAVNFARNEEFLQGSLKLARRLQGKPDFYEEWNEILDGLMYLTDFIDDNEKLLAETVCCKARGEFVCGNLSGCEKIYEENRDLIEKHAPERDLLDYEYIGGTIFDYVGKREKSLEAFRRLLAMSEGKYPDYYVKALAGIIWNDHFNDLADGLKKLSIINLDECDADSVMQAELVSARTLLSAGRIGEALEKYEKVFSGNTDALWKFDIVSRKNQMLAIESIVAAYDSGDYALAVRYGEKIRENLGGAGGIPECYCLSWLSLSYNKTGDTKKADELLSQAERVYETSCGGSLWLKAHLTSMQASYMLRNGDLAGSIEAFKRVEEISEETDDAWVRGDACFSIITEGYLLGVDADPDGKYKNTLFALAASTGLPHLKYKAEVWKLLSAPANEAAQRISEFYETPSLPSVSPEYIKKLIDKKNSEIK